MHKIVYTRVDFRVGFWAAAEEEEAREEPGIGPLIGK
jgi:hypothetical protein